MALELNVPNVPERRDCGHGPDESALARGAVTQFVLNHFLDAAYPAHREQAAGCERCLASSIGAAPFAFFGRMAEVIVHRCDVHTLAFLLTDLDVADRLAEARLAANRDADRVEPDAPNAPQRFDPQLELNAAPRSRAGFVLQHYGREGYLSEADGTVTKRDASAA